MEDSTTSIRLSGLARRLVNDNLLSEQDAETAQQAAKEANVGFVTHLVNNKMLSSKDIAWAASQEFGVPLFDLDTMNMELAATSVIEEKLIRKHNALPLYQRGNKLYVAVSDPTNLRSLDEFQFSTRLNTVQILVDEQQLSTGIERALDDSDQQLDDFGDAELDDIDLGPDDTGSQQDDDDVKIDDTPVVRFINGILTTAIKA
ncbi:MAG: type IV-A pilus assembly ATPase PilB, partial [Gammaproteobacteria bacterium]